MRKRSGTTAVRHKNAIAYDNIVKSVSEIADNIINFHTVPLNTNGFSPSAPNVICVIVIVRTEETNDIKNVTIVTASVFEIKRFLLLPK